MKVELPQIWTELLHQPDSNWRLAEVGLRIAAIHAYPKLAVAKYLQRLDDSSAQIRQNLLESGRDTDIVMALNNYMFVQEGFSGSNDNYFDPKASFINDVLDSKHGIPISLSIIYMDVAGQLGLEVDGINFPGHFLTRMKLADEWLYIDPYHDGRQLDLPALNDLYRQQTGSTMSLDMASPLLHPASKRAIVVRMLRNLKRIYIENKEIEKSLMTIEMILSLLPDAADEIRDRGMIYHHIGYTPGAISDLRYFLQLVPDSEEHNVVKAVIESLAEQNTHIH